MMLDFLNEACRRRRSIGAESRGFETLILGDK
jgi:hypothetical protein